MSKPDGRTARALLRELVARQSPARAKLVARYFKTGPGQYGHGDRFLGLTLPQVRQLVRANRELPLAELARLIRSEWHEARAVALLIMVRQHARGTPAERDRLHRLYLRSTKFVNNWDLVDLSAAQLVGAHLPRGRRGLLRRLARSRRMWERRIAIVATLWFIRENQFTDTLAVANLLLDDEEDLIHKATGWMLREVGKRDQARLERFLRVNIRRLPRTALRYAIERFPPRLRKRYLEME